MRVFLFVAIILCCCNCASKRKLLKVPESTESCKPATQAMRLDSLSEASKTLVWDNIESCEAELSNLPQEFLTTADAIVITPVLCAYLKSRNQNGQFHPKTLAYRLQINYQAELALLQVNDFIAELECEIQRTSQVKSALDDYINRRMNNAMLWGIWVGGVLGVVTDVAGIMGRPEGEVTALSLSTTILSTYAWQKSMGYKKRALLQHPNNHLLDVWQLARQETRLIPPIVWNFINRPMVVNAIRTSRRKQMLKRWEEGELINQKNMSNPKSTEMLIFSLGGGYRSDELGVRITMLRMLKIQVESLTHELLRFQEQMLLLDYTKSLKN